MNCTSFGLDMNIIDALVVEHMAFSTVFNEVERAVPNLKTLSEVKLLAGVVEGLLRGHAEVETNLVYLAFDHVMEERGQLDNLQEDHHEIDARLQRLQAARTFADARRQLKEALAATRAHFSEEEESVFPLIQRVLRKETLEELGDAWSQQNKASQPAASESCGGLKIVRRAKQNQP
jgi:hemerythrin-like domain-containing protein